MMEEKQLFPFLNKSVQLFIDVNGKTYFYSGILKEVAIDFVMIDDVKLGNTFFSMDKVKGVLPR